MRRRGDTPRRLRVALALLLTGVQWGAWGAAPDAPPAHRPARDPARVEASSGAGRARTAAVRPRAGSPLKAGSLKTTRAPSGRVAPGRVTRRACNVAPHAPAFRPSAPAFRLQGARVAASGRSRAAASAVLGGPAMRDPRHGDGVIGRDPPTGHSSPRR
jgi:hypothetical protein